MRDELKKKLNKEIWKNRKKTALSIFGVLLLFPLIGVLFSTSSNEEVFGELLSMGMTQTETGSYPRLRVKLDTGETVIAKARQSFLFRKGKRVKIVKRSTFIGMTTYIFVKYMNDQTSSSEK